MASDGDTEWDTEADWIDSDESTEASAGVGTLLGNRYRLDYKVGEGGMGVVYRATDVEVNGEIFAVKVLKPAIQKRPEALKLVREEVRKTRGLRHPNIVGVYSLNSDPTGAYMLMEYLEGKSVSALMDEEFGRGMPLMRAWPLIQDIGSALAYAHDHNVIHSDLKPSNLFVTVSGKAMLLDFGIARAVRVRAGRFDTGSLGALTPAYASSEMLAGHSPDQSDDVYAFACVIYEMLSGKHPFNSLSAGDAQRMGMRPAPLSCLNTRQNQALSRALAFDRGQRTASVEALLSGLRGSARPRRRWDMWLGVGAAACIVAGLAVWAVLHKSAPDREQAGRPETAANTPAPVSALPEKKEPVVAVRPPDPVRIRDSTPAPSPSPSPPPTIALAAKPASTVAPTPNLPAPAPAPAATMGTTGSTASPIASPDKPLPTVTALKSPGVAAPALPGQSVAVVPETPPVAHSAPVDTGGVAPIGKKVQSIIPSPDAAEKLASCPYPEDARSQMETGTVVMMVYVSQSGAATNAQVDTSSGSASLDQAAVNCVMQFGQFAPHYAGGKRAGYWGRMKFNWSFGG